MRKFSFILTAFAIIFATATTSAQQKKQTTTTSINVNISRDTAFNYKKPQKSVTYGTVTVEGKKINYQADAGTLVLKNKEDSPTLSMSYIAYFDVDQTSAKRPITFIYNGGPGSATIWLHMGAFGPQRVYLQDTGRVRAPYKTVNNEYSLLDASDLVFIDAPGTGFGEVITKQRGGAGTGKDFFGIDEDARAFTDFITQFITDYNRWNSPKYLFGESYGTFRSAVVSNQLEQNGISLNGVIMLSQLLSYSNMTELAKANVGSDLPYQFILPSFAATAWYHNKLPSKPADLESFLKEVENFAMTDYALALGKGATLDEATFHSIAQKIHEYTGLPQAYIEKANLRITGPQFEHELLNDSGKITGRLDSRFAGDAFNPLGENAEYDPMDSYIDAAFTATFNNYVRQDLNFGKNLKYKTRGDVQPWNFHRRGFGFPNVMNDLAEAMVYDPQLKVMLNMGYFDLGTPYFQGMYEMHHLPMPASLQKNIEFHKYKSGHMVYLHPDGLKQLHDNVKAFIEKTNG